MSVSMSYGVCKLLPYDATFDEQMKFFDTVYSNSVLSIHEVIQVYDDTFTKVGPPRLFWADSNKILEKLPPFDKTDADRMHAYKHERQQISYDMWGVLSSVEIFVPYNATEEPWTIEVATKGKLNMASLDWGIAIAGMMIEEEEDEEEQEMWKQVMETFRGAYTHDFFVVMSD